MTGGVGRASGEAGRSGNRGGTGRAASRTGRDERRVREWRGRAGRMSDGVERAGRDPRLNGRRAWRDELEAGSVRLSSTAALPPAPLLGSSVDGCKAPHPKKKYFPQTRKKSSISFYYITGYASSPAIPIPNYPITAPTPPCINGVS